MKKINRKNLTELLSEKEMKLTTGGGVDDENAGLGCTNVCCYQGECHITWRCNKDEDCSSLLGGANCYCW